MKRRSELKSINWQDVSNDTITKEWSFGDEDIKNEFLVARYKNAYAYGNIRGEGIDVRCDYADEVVDTYFKTMYGRDMEFKLQELGWNTDTYTRFELIMTKGNDIVTFSLDDKDTCCYMKMDISSSINMSDDIEDYYDAYATEEDVRRLAILFRRTMAMYVACNKDNAVVKNNSVMIGSVRVDDYPYINKNLCFMKVVGSDAVTIFIDRNEDFSTLYTQARINDLENQLKKLKGE